MTGQGTVIAAMAVTALALLSLAALLILSPSWRRWRHDRRWSKARRVHERLNSFDRLTARGLEAYLQKIDPYVFEELVLYAYSRRGCKVKRNRRYSGDGGIDGRVWIDGRKHLVQAKRYSGYIKMEHVADFITLCRKKRTRGIFAYTGTMGKGPKNLIDVCEDMTGLGPEELYRLIIDRKEEA